MQNRIYENCRLHASYLLFSAVCHEPYQAAPHSCSRLTFVSKPQLSSPLHAAAADITSPGKNLYCLPATHVPWVGPACLCRTQPGFDRSLTNPNLQQVTEDSQQAGCGGWSLKDIPRQAGLLAKVRCNCSKRPASNSRSLELLLGTVHSHCAGRCQQLCAVGACRTAVACEQRTQCLLQVCPLLLLVALRHAQVRSAY
jgi:hypothetical protein